MAEQPRFVKVEFSAAKIDALLELLRSQPVTTAYTHLGIVEAKLFLARGRVEVAP